MSMCDSPKDTGKADLGPDAFSVVIVSDYASTATKTWHDLRTLAAMLAAQDAGEAAEFIYVEHPDAARAMPDDVRTTLPKLRLLLDASASSYGRRNAGVRAAATPWVAMLDADCRPGPGWLREVRRIVGASRGTVVSGRTRYPGRGPVERILALLSRAYVDRGKAGPTEFIAAHQCVFRRDAYLECPLPTDAGVYAARVQSDAMLRRGDRLWFDPALECVHDFEGWPMERDIRRNTGHCTISVRQYDPSIPYAWLVRLGPVVIPAIVAGKTWLVWKDVIRCFPYYDVGWRHLPLALALAVWVHLLEIEGMWRAFRHRPIEDTAYR